MQNRGESPEKYSAKRSLAFVHVQSNLIDELQSSAVLVSSYIQQATICGKMATVASLRLESIRRLRRAVRQSGCPERGSPNPYVGRHTGEVRTCIAKASLRKRNARRATSFVAAPMASKLVVSARSNPAEKCCPAGGVITKQRRREGAARHREKTQTVVGT